MRPGILKIDAIIQGCMNLPTPPAAPQTMHQHNRLDKALSGNNLDVTNALTKQAETLQETSAENRQMKKHQQQWLECNLINTIIIDSIIRKMSKSHYIIEDV